MTQLEQAKQAAERLLKNIEDTAAMRDLEDALEAAQNPPPEGDADGSIDAGTWNYLRGFRDELAEVRSTVEWLRGKKVL